MRRTSLRGLGNRTPLGLKLVAAVVLLVVVALIGVGLLATTALRGYLVSRNDEQLREVATDAAGRSPGPAATSACEHDGGPGGHSPDETNNGAAHRGLPSPFYVQYAQADGTIVEQQCNPMRATDAAPALPRLTLADVRARGATPFTVPATSGTTAWRVIAMPLTDGSGSLLVAQSVGSIEGTVHKLIALEVLGGGAVVLVLAVVGYVIVRRSLRPLVDVEETAEAIAAGDLTRRVPDTAHPRTEVGRLSLALNGMLHQIEGAFAERAASESAAKVSEASARASEARMRRFVADASHELRTPLTSIHGFADLVQRGAVTDVPGLVQLMGRIGSEADRMRGLVEDLLSLARLDQQRPLQRQRVELVDLVADAVLDARAVAPERSIELEVDGATRPAVDGDESRLRQVLANLVMNALVHTPAESSVVVRLSRRGDQAVIEVVDDGPGMAPGDAALVFERFYRSDDSRSRDSGGSGLGLSIVRSIVEAHGGTVEVQTAPGEGATFRVWLPAARADAG